MDASYGDVGDEVHDAGDLGEGIVFFLMGIMLVEFVLVGVGQ